MGEYRARYKEIFDNDHHQYIEYLKKTVPIMHPNNDIVVFSDVLSKSRQHHLIIHKEIYAKIKSPNGLYGYLNMNQILFTISIISMKNATILQGPTVVSGDDLETFIHIKHNKTGKHIFDETQTIKVYGDKYIQRVCTTLNDGYALPLQNVLYSSQDKLRADAVDPPEEGSIFKV